MQAYNADRAALAAAILARQLESQQPLGPAQPIKSLLDYSPDRHAHSTDSRGQIADSSQQAAAAEASPSFSAELSAEVVWRPEREGDSQVTQLALGDHQSDSQEHEQELLPQADFEISRTKSLEAASQHHQGLKAWRQRTSDMEDEAALHASTSLQLLNSTQAEAEATRPIVALDSGSSAQPSIAEPFSSSLQDHRLDLRSGSHDDSRRSVEQPQMQLLPDLNQDAATLLLADQQRPNGGSQYLQELQHQQQLRAHSASLSPESRQSGNHHVSALFWAESGKPSDAQHDSIARSWAAVQSTAQVKDGLECQSVDRPLLAEGQANNSVLWTEADQVSGYPQDDEAVVEAQLESVMQPHLPEAAAAAEGPSACSSPDQAHHLARAAAQSPVTRLETGIGAKRSHGDGNNAFQPPQEQQQAVSATQKGTRQATAMIKGMSDYSSHTAQGSFPPARPAHSLRQKYSTACQQIPKSIP